MNPLQVQSEPMMKSSASTVSMSQKAPPLDSSRPNAEVVMASSDKFIINKRDFLPKTTDSRKQLFSSFTKQPPSTKSKNETNGLFITKEVSRTNQNPFKSDKSSFIYYYQNENNFLGVIPQMEKDKFYQGKIFYPPIQNKQIPFSCAVPYNYQGFIKQGDIKNDMGAQLQFQEKVLPDKTEMQKRPNKIKENYLDILIEAADALIRKGLNIDSLKELRPSPKIMHHPIRHSLTQPPNTKCENKVCPVYFTKKTNCYTAKIVSLKNKTLRLCYQCYQAWKNGQYCYYCGVIYRQYRGTKGFNDHKTWIGCEFCKNWEHVQCEEQKGVFTNLSQLIKKDKHFKYKCPVCRSKEDNTASSRKNSKDESEKSMLGNKRKEENTGKRRIKKRKEFDEYGNGYGYINDKEDKKEDELMDDIEELKRLSSKR